MCLVGTYYKITVKELENTSRKRAFAETVCHANASSKKRRTSANDENTVDSKSTDNAKRTPGKRKQARKVPGFVNDGNLCYLNSIMQATLANKPFVAEILRLEQIDDGSRATTRPVTEEIATLVHKRQQLEVASAASSRRDLPSLRGLKAALAMHVPAFFTKEDQQDADEAFIHIVDAISKENPSYRCPFSHTIGQTITCSNCGHKSLIEEQHIRQTMNLRPKSGKPSIENVVADTSEKLLRGCNQCKGAAIEHTCSRTIVAFPQTLVVQLGRVDDWLQKIDDKFAPEETDKYKLGGIVHHRGSGRRGHYYAAVRSEDDEWSLADDARVRNMKHADALKRSSTCSMFFYDVHTSHRNCKD